jgi:SAM-dependent MidA family methyltransferase
MNELIDTIPIQAIKQDRTAWPRAEYDEDALAR